MQPTRLIEGVVDLDLFTVDVGPDDFAKTMAAGALEMGAATLLVASGCPGEHSPSPL